MIYSVERHYGEILCPRGIGAVNWYRSEQGIDRVLGGLARCGGQFVGDMKEYLL